MQYPMTSTALVDIVDTGRLFVALNNLKAYNPDLGVNDILFTITM